MIRDATPADVPALVALGESFLAHPPYDALMRSNPVAIAALMDRLIADPDGVVYVAIDRAGVPVGMLGALCFAHLLSGEWIAGQLFWWVEPAARGGIDGMRLWALTRAWARTRGARRLVMHAPAGSGLARVYARRGGVPVETAYQFELHAGRRPLGQIDRGVALEVGDDVERPAGAVLGHEVPLLTDAEPGERRLERVGPARDKGQGQQRGDVGDGRRLRLEVVDERGDVLADADHAGILA